MLPTRDEHPCTTPLTTTYFHREHTRGWTFHDIRLFRVAAIVSLIAHFLVGAAKSLFTLRTWWAAGLEMTAAGVIVGGATYVLGLILKVSG